MASLMPMEFIVSTGKAAYSKDRKAWVIDVDKRETIVRCRDCRKYHGQDDEIGTCDLGFEDTGLYSIVEPDGFCKWGERSE